MALNIQTFKTRALTALLFVAVMLVGLFWNIWSFLVLFTIIHFGCWYELIKLLKKIYGRKFLRYSLLGLIYISMPVLMMIHLGLTLKSTNAEMSGAHFAQPAWISVVFSTVIPCGIIFSIWINDTMAYLVGSFIGKTPLSKISPKKTWEGTIGGIILCVLVMGLLYPLVVAGVADPAIKPVTWFIIPAICAIFGTLGDLLESKIKRMADVKDSGSFMPGHGGFLDRFDSLLVAVPFVWLFVKILL